jgi:hypothetical protein
MGVGIEIIRTWSSLLGLQTGSTWFGEAFGTDIATGFLGPWQAEREQAKLQWAVRKKIILTGGKR